MRYLALSPATAAVELRRGAEITGLPTAAALPRELYRYDVDLATVVDLRDDATRQLLGVTLEELLAADRTQSPARLGRSARRHAGDHLSVRDRCGDVLVVFVDNLGDGTCEPHVVTT